MKKTTIKCILIDSLFSILYLNEKKTQQQQDEQARKEKMVWEGGEKKIYELNSTSYVIFMG